MGEFFSFPASVSWDAKREDLFARLGGGSDVPLYLRRPVQPLSLPLLPVTLVLPLLDPRSILLQPPLRPGFYPNVIPLPFSRHPELWLITYRRSL